MVDQASRLKERNSPIGNLTKSLRSVIFDGIDLATLQTDLLKKDFIRSKHSLARVGGGLAISLVLSVTAFPLLALGAANFFTAQFGWSLWFSQFIVGISILFLASLMIWVAWRSLKSAASSFEPTLREFQTNLHWLRETITQASSEE